MTVDIVSAHEGLEAAFQEAARRIFATCRRSSANEPVVIALCGGRSVVGLLSALRGEALSQPADLINRIHFFMVDERLVPLSDEQSNFGGISKLLFDDMLREGVVSKDQLHPFVVNPAEDDYGCARYADELQHFGGRFSVVVLGVGEDGHIAGLFPQHPILQRKDPAFFAFHDSPKPPPDRMTAGAQLIREADLSILLVLGEGKRDAWNRFKQQGVRLEECPAVLARESHECLVITDLE